MHFAKLDLIPSKQFGGLNLPVTFHITVFIAGKSVSPRTAHMEKHFFAYFNNSLKLDYVLFFLLYNINLLQSPNNRS